MRTRLDTLDNEHVQMTRPGEERAVPVRRVYIATNKSGSRARNLCSKARKETGVGAQGWHFYAALLWHFLDGMKPCGAA
ncbi:hypothetical protein NDU88_008738 [Pleurodeles waltl]|uniref:Uncharacterized protein n=1 Tax=Pleurodeles waltl TaxID=8319 RepID=A0AAV7N876_PLEWA|nr:hypothetical protein NDU88_008738 [Pleurodeles waltl]